MPTVQMERRERSCGWMTLAGNPAHSCKARSVGRSFNGEKRPVSASSETNEDEHPVPLAMLQATCRGTG